MLLHCRQMRPQQGLHRVHTAEAFYKGTNARSTRAQLPGLYPPGGGGGGGGPGGGGGGGGGV